MFLFTQSDATKYPPNFQSTSCTGLEQLTGADLCIAKVAIPPTVNLGLHIANHSLFVQIKIDGDNLSFDAIHRFIARVQAAKIPRSQAILLRIGKKWFDSFEKKDTTKYSETTWQAYTHMLMANSLRGIAIYPEVLQTVDDLPQWIEDYYQVISKIESEGGRDIYPVRPTFEPDNIWQDIKEVEGWRKFLVCGLDDFGSKRALALKDYLQENNPKHLRSMFFALSALTDESPDGKAMYNISGIGDVLRKKYREALEILPGWNLGEMIQFNAYWQGWNDFGTKFMSLVIDKKKSPKEAYELLINKDFPIMEDINNEIPF